jgi:hypothetical protein
MQNCDSYVNVSVEKVIDNLSSIWDVPHLNSSWELALLTRVFCLIFFLWMWDCKNVFSEKPKQIDISQHETWRVQGEGKFSPLEKRLCWYSCCSMPSAALTVWIVALSCWGCYVMKHRCLARQNCQMQVGRLLDSVSVVLLIYTYRVSNLNLSKVWFIELALSNGTVVCYART